MGTWNTCSVLVMGWRVTCLLEDQGNESSLLSLMRCFSVMLIYLHVFLWGPDHWGQPPFSALGQQYFLISEDFGHCLLGLLIPAHLWASKNIIMVPEYLSWKGPWQAPHANCCGNDESQEPERPNGLTKALQLAGPRICTRTQVSFKKT